MTKGAAQRSLEEELALCTSSATNLTHTVLGSQREVGSWIIFILYWSPSLSSSGRLYSQSPIPGFRGWPRVLSSTKEAWKQTPLPPAGSQLSPAFSSGTLVTVAMEI